MFPDAGKSGRRNSRPLIIKNIKADPMKRLHRLLCAISCLVLLCQAAFAQEKTISGTVTDMTGLPVIGAAVIDVQDRTSGSLTDVDGNFKQSVAQGGTLLFKYVGYKDLKKKITLTIAVRDTNLESVIDHYGIKDCSVLKVGASSLALFSLRQSQHKDSP